MIDDALHAYEFARTERPPLLWHAAFDDVSLRLLVEALVNASGRDATALDLNISNLVIEQDAADSSLPVGEYVAVTLSGSGTWAEDDRWSSSGSPSSRFLSPFREALANAGARAAYSRRIGDRSSVTVLFPRVEVDQSKA